MAKARWHTRKAGSIFAPHIHLSSLDNNYILGGTPNAKLTFSWRKMLSRTAVRGTLVSVLLGAIYGLEKWRTVWFIPWKRKRAMKYVNIALRDIIFRLSHPITCPRLLVNLLSHVPSKPWKMSSNNYHCMLVRHTESCVQRVVRRMIVWIKTYNPIYLISVMSWTASVR